MDKEITHNPFIFLMSDRAVFGNPFEILLRQSTIFLPCSVSCLAFTHVLDALVAVQYSSLFFHSRSQKPGRISSPALFVLHPLPPRILCFHSKSLHLYSPSLASHHHQSINHSTLLFSAFRQSTISPRRASPSSIRVHVSVKRRIAV